MTASSTRCVIALGSNLGDRLENLVVGIDDNRADRHLAKSAGYNGLIDGHLHELFVSSIHWRAISRFLASDQ